MKVEQVVRSQDGRKTFAALGFTGWIKRRRSTEAMTDTWADLRRRGWRYLHIHICTYRTPDATSRTVTLSTGRAVR